MSIKDSKHNEQNKAGIFKESIDNIKSSVDYLDTLFHDIDKNKFVNQSTIQAKEPSIYKKINILSPNPRKISKISNKKKLPGKTPVKGLNIKRINRSVERRYERDSSIETRNKKVNLSNSNLKAGNKTFCEINENFKAKNESEKEKKIYQEKIKILQNKINALIKQEYEINRRMHYGDLRHAYLYQMKKEKEDMKKALFNSSLEKRKQLDFKRNVIKMTKKTMCQNLKESLEKSREVKAKTYQYLKDEKNLTLHLITERNSNLNKYLNKNANKIKKDRKNMKTNNNKFYYKTTDEYYLYTLQNNKNETKKLKEKLKKLERVEAKYIDNLSRTKSNIDSKMNKYLINYNYK